MKVLGAGYKSREPEELDFPKEPARILGELVELHRERLNYSVADLARLLVLEESEVIAQYGVPADVTRRPDHLRLISLREAPA